MVNGKPQLTFGGVQSADPSTTRQRAVARGAESFASYLSAGENGVRVGRRTDGPVPPAVAQSHTSGVGRNVAPPSAKMFLGHLPDNYISPQHGSLSAGRPSAGQSAPPARGLWPRPRRRLCRVPAR